MRDKEYEMARLATLCRASHAAMMQNFLHRRRGIDDHVWRASVDVWLRACEALLNSSTEGEER